MSYTVIVDKSTVPVGTADKVKAAVAAALAVRGLGDTAFAVVSNPEFLKEGAAVEDCMRPDRIVVGADDERALLLMRALYTPFMRNHDLDAGDARDGRLQCRVHQVRRQRDAGHAHQLHERAGVAR